MVRGSADERVALAHGGAVSDLASRAEDIASHLVSHALSAEVTKFDVDGRQSAVDFLLVWPDGRRGALEVTVVTDPRSSGWQGLAAREDWRWPAPSGWEFRLHSDDMPYRRTRHAVLKAVELCDLANVDALEQLSPELAARAPDLEWLSGIGELRRAASKPGVVVLPAVRSEFVDAVTTRTSPTWSRIGFICRTCPVTSTRPDQLALSTRDICSSCLSDEVLSARFFTNDFPTPDSEPQRLQRHRRNLGVVQLLASVLGLSRWQLALARLPAEKLDLSRAAADPGQDVQPRCAVVRLCLNAAWSE